MIHSGISIYMIVYVSCILYIYINIYICIYIYVSLHKLLESPRNGFVDHASIERCLHNVAKCCLWLEVFIMSQHEFPFTECITHFKRLKFKLTGSKQSQNCLFRKPYWLQIFDGLKFYTIKQLKQSQNSLLSKPQPSLLHVIVTLSTCSVAGIMEGKWACVSHEQEFQPHIDGLVQERCNSIALAMELRLSCTYPSICCDVAFWMLIYNGKCIYKIYIMLSLNISHKRLTLNILLLQHPQHGLINWSLENLNEIVDK